MSTEGLLTEAAPWVARWFDRSDDLALLQLSPAGDVLQVNRAFARRSGRTGSEASLRLTDLFEDAAGQPAELVCTPPFHPPIQQLLTARGDGTQWQCAAFELPGGDTLLLGTKERSTEEDRARGLYLDVAEVAAIQRLLLRRNRELHQAKAEVDDLLRVDPLTGLPNRRALAERLAEELSRATRQGSPLSAVVCDLDHFKAVNDDAGHASGDLVLASFGQILRQHTRPSDVPARVGGEEFTVLLPATELAGAAALAERVRSAAAERIQPALGRAVTASFGVAQWQVGESVAAWLERADGALYAAKRAGRDRVFCADEA